MFYSSSFWFIICTSPIPNILAIRFIYGGGVWGTVTTTIYTELQVNIIYIYLLAALFFHFITSTYTSRSASSPVDVSSNTLYVRNETLGSLLFWENNKWHCGVMWNDMNLRFCYYPKVNYFTITEYSRVFYSSYTTEICQGLQFFHLLKNFIL